MILRNKSLTILIAYACMLLASAGCSNAQEESLKTVTTEIEQSISIVSPTCESITAVLPDRGPYDGISLKFNPLYNKYDLNFEYLPYQNEKPTPVGLLSLEEISEIINLIINKGQCENSPDSPRFFISGEEFILNIDWGLVTELFDTGIEGTKIITNNIQGEMTTKPLQYREMTYAFNTSGAADAVCNLLNQDQVSCVEKSCDEEAKSRFPEACLSKWQTKVYARYSKKVRGVPMAEICKVTDCGLERHSKFELMLRAK